MKKMMLLFVVVVLIFSSCASIDDKNKSVSFESDPDKVNFSQEENSGLTYKNHECGYQITFPESWDGWYAVDNTGENITRVKFVGKSKTGSIAGNEDFDGGLPMFFIVPDKCLDSNIPMDSVKKIGTSHGIDYYYATGTGSDITALLEIADENSAVRQIAKYDVDEEELQLAAIDWKKVQKMQEEVEDVLNSFKEINIEQ